MFSAILLLAILPAVHAQEGHITLLTVTDDEAQHGSTADLYLRIEPGEGAIYIDSFPLTKVDTQSSVRYANQIACDLLQEDCDRYDFFYTIRANSGLVGGPSAGAAIAVLTAAMLDDQDVDQRIAMTGTINSGGIVGPVAGIIGKVDGARQAKITTVLVPALLSYDDLHKRETQNSTDLSRDNTTRDYRVMTGRIDALSTREVAVIGVSTIEEALTIITGKNYTRDYAPITPPAEYTERMRTVSDELCLQGDEFLTTLGARGIMYNDTYNYTARIEAMDAARSYSRASLCFSRNIELATLLFGNVTNATRVEAYDELRRELATLLKETREREITTITDLETYAIVRERLLEAEQLLDDTERDDPNPRLVAYAQERMRSARIWSAFFGIPGTPVDLDTKYLERACLAKLAEADERVNYVRIYVPDAVDDAQELLDVARGYSRNEPILCIFSASKAKAQANLLAGAITVGKDGVDGLIQQKLAADRIVLAKQAEKGFFPIIGYSYTQYAEDLRATTPYSALTFAEYALELSTLDLYFPKEESWHLPPGLLDMLLVFGSGACFGFGLALFVLARRKEGPATKAAGRPVGKTVSSSSKNVRRKK
jgi:uncharacterized protein